MKLKYILSICLSLFLVMNIFSQAAEKKITISFRDIPLSEAINRIEKVSEYNFFYDNSTIDLKQKVSLDAKNLPVQLAVKQMLANSDLTFELTRTQIALYQKNSNQSTKQIEGTVTDAKGQALIGVSVFSKSTNKATISDGDGKFSIEVVPNSILQVSYLGYLPQKITITNQSKLSVVLEEEVASLKEVVVVGYGTQKKANLTGSVEVVTAKQLESRPAANITALLQGNVAGIRFSPPGGGFSPGAAQTMEIRGSASLSGSTPPLIVINGVPTDVGDFNTLNPDDVESISVLKDAAASAIYGSRAPYGVIIVTLKKGKRNQKAVITYSNNFAVVKPINYPNPTDSYTFALSKNEAYKNNEMSPIWNASQLAIIKGNVEHPENYTLDQLVPLLPDGSYGYGDNGLGNINWFDVWLKDGQRQNHELSVRGGTEKTGYYASVGYLKQPGIFNYMAGNDKYTRLSVNGGFNTDINNWIKFGFNTRYSKNETLSPSNGMSLLYRYMYGAYPMVPLKNPNGEWNESSRVMPYLYGGYVRNSQHRLDNILEVDLKPAKGWDVHVDGTWRMFFQDYQSLSSPYSYAYWADERMKIGSEGSISKTFNINNYWTVQAHTSYTKIINKHTFRAQVGMQAEEANNSGLSGSGQKMLIPDNFSINLSQANKTTSDALSTWSTQGFFGRLNYNFDERYLLELNGRYDGSARYSANKRWGFFPSASAGWVMSREDFWKKIESVVNFAKTRISAGTLGDQGNTANFLYIPTLTVSPNSSWVFGNATLPYVNTPGILNPDITWTKISTVDIAQEFKFLNNRLSLEYDYFHRRTWDALGPPSPVPSVLGTSAPQINNTEFITTGFEVQLGWKDKIGTHWDYDTRIFVSDAHSTITKYNVANKYVGQWYPGMKLGDIWGYSANRLLNASDFNTDGSLKISQNQISTKWFNGDLKYEDLNGDGQINTGDGTIKNSGDKKIIGNSTPRYNYSMSFNMGYTFNKAGRLDFSMLLQGVGKWMQAGNDSFYYWGMGSETGNNSDVNVYTGGHQLDFYRDDRSSPELLALLGTNTDAFFPRPYASNGGFKNFQASDKYLINRAYLRLKNVQLSYTLPSDWINQIRMQSCRIYFSGENMLTFQDSSLPYYIDPEIPGFGRSYVQQATYSLGVNVAF